MKKRFAIAFCAGVTALHAGQDTAPDWVREVATRTLSSYPPEVRTVRLLDESHVTVRSDGSTETVNREAVRIVSAEGRDAAAAEVAYDRKTSKIRDFRAWMLAPDGSVKAYGKNDILDVNPHEQFELYMDSRYKVIKAGGAPPGSVFVWTSDVEEHPFQSQMSWWFQGRDPVLQSRLVLTLPPNWEAKAVVFNHAPIAPMVDGNTYTWDLKNLDYIKEENGSPKAASIAPWIGVTYYDKSNPNAVREWRDLAVREAKRDEPQADSSDELNRKVAQLTGSASDAVGKIRAVARYVQGLKYVEIATNLATGGGYLPHPASEVFTKGYGDCKDKANLMRTMLRQAGIQSYMVAVYSGDRNHVQAQWPSATQFNHMILAIQVPDTVSLPSVTTYPGLGKLLIFDATDQFTPVGLIPGYEQGSYGLLIAGDKGGSIQLPIAPADANLTDITVEGSLSPTGGLEAKLCMKNRADTATLMHERQDYLGDRFLNELRSWLQQNVHQFEAAKFETKAMPDEGEVDLNVDFKAPHYGQLMQNRILVVRPSIVEPFFRFPLQSEKRIHPLVLDSESLHKEVHVKLPAAFKIDEAPDPVSFSSSFGSYKADCKIKGDDLLFTEDLTINAVTLPAERYSEARDFFGKVLGAENAPVVMVRN